MKLQELFPVPSEWIQETDESIAATVSGWAEQEVIARRLEHREDFDELLMPAMKMLLLDIGLQSMLFPGELGGGGLCTPDAAMTATSILEQVGRADTGIGFLLANTLALQSTFCIEPHRDERLIEEMAPAFTGDEVTVGSLVLPYYGGPEGESERFSGLPYQVNAKSSDGQWVLSGESVRPQCAGTIAGVFGVVCGADGEPAMLLVKGDDGGLARGDVFKATGLAASVNADVTFKDVTVPDKRVAFEGADRMREMLCWYYLSCSAVITGALLASHGILKEWGETRVIKGKGNVFKDNPLVAALMGEIGGRTGIARILTYNVARLLSRPAVYGPAGGWGILATATAVFRQVARSAMDSLDNTMELMASAGYATEWNLERYWRDVKTVEAYVVPETAAQADMARHYFNSRTV